MKVVLNKNLPGAVKTKDLVVGRFYTPAGGVDVYKAFVILLESGESAIHIMRVDSGLARLATWYTCVWHEVKTNDTVNFTYL